MRSTARRSIDGFEVRMLEAEFQSTETPLFICRGTNRCLFAKPSGRISGRILRGLLALPRPARPTRRNGFPRRTTVPAGEPPPHATAHGSRRDSCGADHCRTHSGVRTDRRERICGQAQKNGADRIRPACLHKNSRPFRGAIILQLQRLLPRRQQPRPCSRSLS